MPDRLQQRAADCSGPGLRRDSEGDDPRDACRPDTAARAPRSQASRHGWASRRAAGKATPSSSSRRISTAERSFRGSSPKMKLIERFTRVAPNVLEYRFTVEDPDTWTKTLDGDVPFRQGRRASTSWSSTRATRRTTASRTSSVARARPRKHKPRPSRPIQAIRSSFMTLPDRICNRSASLRSASRIPCRAWG